MSLTELIEELQCLEEHIGEFAAEMANERALFGDSGPGTQLRLNEMRERAAELRRQIDAGKKRRSFNATREQWTKTWRTARVLASQGREPARAHHDSMLWRAFVIAVEERHEPLPWTVRDRLAMKRDDYWDIPF